MTLTDNPGVPALAALNTTDVAFIDNTNEDLRVYRFDGTDWAQVGSDLNVVVTFNSPRLTALNGTDVAFIDSSNQDLRVYRFNGSNWTSGTGTPEGNVVGDRGDLFTRKDGGVGTTLYSKEADDGMNTGWEPK